MPKQLSVIALLVTAVSSESTCGEVETLFKTGASCCGAASNTTIPPRVLMPNALLKFTYGGSTSSIPVNVTGPFGLFWNDLMGMQHNVLEVTKATFDACHALTENPGGQFPDAAMAELYPGFESWRNNTPDERPDAFINLNAIPRAPDLPTVSGIYVNNFCTADMVGTVKYFVCQISHAAAASYAQMGYFGVDVNKLYAGAVAIVNTLPGFALDPTNSTTAIYSGIHCPNQHIAIRCNAA